MANSRPAHAPPSRRSDTRRAPARKSPGRSLLWLQGLLCGALVGFATGTALLLFILLAPSMVALAADRAPGRPVARAMLLFGLSATVLPMQTLWRAGHTVDAAIGLGAAPETLVIAWSAQAGGWLLAELAPLLIRLAIDASAFSRKRRLRAWRERCATEWGLPKAEPADAGRQAPDR